MNCKAVAFPHDLVTDTPHQHVPTSTSRLPAHSTHLISLIHSSIHFLIHFPHSFINLIRLNSSQTGNSNTHTHTAFMASYTPELQAPGSAPPPPPPKPGSHDATRISTPTTIGDAASVIPGAPTPYGAASGSFPPPSSGPAGSAAATQQPVDVPDPGDQWLPQILQDKSYVFPILRFSISLVEETNGAFGLCVSHTNFL